jgi:2'-5' RNA ligase
MNKLIISFLSDKKITKALKSKTPVVFLGGDCTDNTWRKKLEKEFGEDLYLMDPFDKKYDPLESTHKELAGIVNSDYVVFYNGGKQSDKEKNFLDLIGKQGRVVKEFDDLAKLKNFLRSLKKVKLSSIGSKIKKCAEMLSKDAVPHIYLDKQHRGVDFHFEKMDTDSIYKVVRDFNAGKTIKVPKNIDENGIVSYDTLNLMDIKDNNQTNDIQFTNYLQYLRNKSQIEKHFGRVNPEHILFHYNELTNAYEDIRHPELAGAIDTRGALGQIKYAKNGVSYDYSFTKIDIPKDLSSAIFKWGKENVPHSDLYTEGDNSKGREDEIHITVLYGIRDTNPASTVKVITGAKSFEVRLGLVNAFKDKKDYDVLKIEVESGELERLHYDMEKKIDCDSTYPTYKPHVTILYAKKGAIDKFIGDESFKGKTFKVNNIVFSDDKNVEKKIPLGI